MKVFILGVSLFIFSEVAVAQTNTVDPNQSYNECATRLQNNGKSPSEAAAECRPLIPGQQDDDEKECNEAFDNFSKNNLGADSEFQKVCAANGTPGGADPLRCLRAAGTCETCAGAEQDSSHSDTYCDGEPGYEEEGALSQIGNQLINQRAQQGGAADQRRVANARRTFAYCPIYAAARLEDIRRQVKDHEELVRDKTDRKNRLMSELQEAQTELQSLTTNYEKLMTDYPKKVEQATKEANDRAMAEFTEIGNQLKTLAINMRTVETDLYEKETKIEGICHGRAEAMVAKERDRREKLQAASQHSTPSLHSLTSLSSTRNQLEQLAIRTKRDCLQKDAQVRRQLAAAKEWARLKKEELKILEGRLLARQDQLMNALKDSQNNPELQSRLAEMQENFDAQRTELEGQLRRQQNAVISLQRELQTLETELIADSSALATFLEERRAAEQAVGGGGGTDENPRSIVSAAAGFVEDHGIAMDMCNCEVVDDAPATASRRPAQQKCARLQRYGSPGEALESGRTNPVRPGDSLQ